MAENPDRTGRRGLIALGRWRLGLLALIGLAAVGHWLIYVFEITIYPPLAPQYLFHYTDNPPGHPLLIAAWISGLLAIVYLSIAPGRRFWGPRLLGLMALGWALPFVFQLTDGRGFEGILLDHRQTAHHQLLWDAVDRPSMSRILFHYEEFLEEEGVQPLNRSKPPGQLLAYMATQRLALQFHQPETRVGKKRWLAKVVLATWQPMACLALIPLFLLTRRMFGAEEAWIACGLYLLIPSFNLLPMHLDIAFYPTLTLATWLAAQGSAERGCVWRGAIAGACFYLAVFFSFGLLFLAPMALGLIVRETWKRRGRFDPWFALRPALGMGFGFAMVDATARLAIGYDIVKRFRGASAHHEAWKDWSWTFERMWTAGAINLVEFFSWLGAPLLLLAFIALGRSIPNLARRNDDESAPLTWPLCATILFLAFFGMTISETMRLWAFLFPWFCLIAAAELRRTFAPAWRRAAAIALVLQGATVYITKVCQDFL